jgi:O-antigen/teichoic acid export membrane protein
MTNVLVPLASEREAQSDWSSLRRVFVIGGNAQALIVAPAGVGVLFLGEAFFRAWLGPGFDRSATYLMLLIAPILAAQGTASSILLGIGRQRWLAVIGVVAAVLTLGGAAALATGFGAVGISAAYAAVGTAANMAIYIYCARLLELPPLRTLLRIWAGPLVAVAPMAAFLGWAAGRLDGGRQFLAFIALAGAAVSVYLAAAAALFRRWPNRLPAIEKLSGILGAGWTRRRARSGAVVAPVDRQAGSLPFER